MRKASLNKVPFLVISLASLFSCSQGNSNDIIRLGFSVSCPCLKSIHAGLESKKQQSLLASFNVFFGMDNGFEEWWNNLEKVMV